MVRHCRWVAGVSVLAGLLLTGTAEGAYSFYQTGATGGSQQSLYAPATTFSGTMTALVPRFNGGLGTLIQADFEWGGNLNGAWQSVPSTGTISASISGPTDVGGQSMGNLAMSFTQPIVDYTPIPYGVTNYTNATFTSGAFFNSLTGVGNETMTWNYSGSTTISVPAVGEFDWGGSVHVLYTYEEVPEAGTLGLLGVGALLALWRTRNERRIRS